MSETNTGLEYVYGLARKRIAQLEIDNAKLRAALQEIADQDYRGNRPYGAEIAFRALKQ